MDLTFVGHQSWAVSSGGTMILVDPVLERSFGHSSRLEFQIWPPRRVDVAAMPEPAAVILTHEHLDHVHFPSLNRLGRDIPVLTGALTPTAVTDNVEQLGFAVIRMLPGSTYRAGNLEVAFYPAGAGTISWEKRVSQLVFAEHGTENGDVFIPVDALTSEMYTDDLAVGKRSAPKLVIMANNSQVVPPGALGAYTNMLPVPGRVRSDMTAIEVLNGLIHERPAEFRSIRNIALCGNGFVSPRSAHGPFLYADHHWLAERANELQHEVTVHGPWPGEQLTVTPDGPVTSSRVPWIELDHDAFDHGLRALEEFLVHPAKVSIVPVQPAFESEKEAEAARKEVEAQLPQLAQILLLTAVGQLASSLHQHLAGPLGPQRMLLVLLDGPGGKTLQYAWDVSRAAFLPEYLPENEMLRRYPFGVKCFFADFVAVLRGEQQIWDLAGTAMQGWYMGDTYATLITAFYEIFGEQVRPDLARKIYGRSLYRLAEAAISDAG